MEKKMKAIVLVAGYASRLYPLTLNTPKALLTVGKSTLLDLLMTKLGELDAINDVVLISNHKFFDNFNEWKKTYNGRLNVTVLDDGTTSNDDRLGAIGDTQFVIDKLGIDEDIMLLVSDNYFTFSFKDYYEFFKSKQADCIMVKKFEDEEKEYMAKNFAVVEVDNDNKVLSMAEKPGGIPNSNLGAIAFYFYTKDSVRLIKKYLNEGNNKDAPGNYPSWLHKIKPVYAYTFKDEWYDVGTIEVLNKLHEKFKNE